MMPPMSRTSPGLRKTSCRSSREKMGILLALPASWALVGLPVRMLQLFQRELQLLLDTAVVLGLEAAAL